jgi:hypothetical protein
MMGRVLAAAVLIRYSAVMTGPTSAAALDGEEP